MFLNAPVACLDAEEYCARARRCAGTWFDKTYCREFAVDIVHQGGAELSKDLQSGWL